MFSLTDEEFEAFVLRCSRLLEEKQALLTRDFGLGTHASFWIDQTVETIEFRDAQGRTAVQATITPIGSYSTDSHTWQWAWANPSIPENLRCRAAQLKGLADHTGVSVFAHPTINADERLCDELSAISVEHLQAQGCYRVPTRHLFVVFALESVHKVS